jgi:hypothetical protein
MDDPMEIDHYGHPSPLDLNEGYQFGSSHARERRQDFPNSANQENGAHLHRAAERDTCYATGFANREVRIKRLPHRPRRRSLARYTRKPPDRYVPYYQHVRGDYYTPGPRANADDVLAEQMADLEVRNDDRGDRGDRGDRRDRGRNRGNNNNNRKRRRDGEFQRCHHAMVPAKLTRSADEDDDLDRRGPPQRRRQDDGPPRRRFEEAPLAKLRRMLLNIAGSAKLPVDEATEIAQGLGENMDDEYLKNEFFDILVQL